MRDEIVLERLRKFLLAAALSIFAVTLLELWLIDHTQEAVQLTPFILCGAGLVVVTAALLHPSRASLNTLRITMLVDALGGLVGVGFHVWRNFTFEQEIRPAVPAGDLLLPALKGAAPLVAPGMLFLAALLAIAATYAHPALSHETEYQ